MTMDPENGTKVPGTYLYVLLSQIFISQSFPKMKNVPSKGTRPVLRPFHGTFFILAMRKIRISKTGLRSATIISSLLFFNSVPIISGNLYTYRNVPYFHSDAFLPISSHDKIKRMSFIVTDSPAAMQNTYRIVTENAKNSSPQRACSGNGSILRFSISDFHLCSGGTVVHTLCPGKSIFWVALSCCIPLSSFPCRSNCLTING